MIVRIINEDFIKKILAVKRFEHFYLECLCWNKLINQCFQQRQALSELTDKEKYLDIRTDGQSNLFKGSLTTKNYYNHNIRYILNRSTKSNVCLKLAHNKEGITNTLFRTHTEIFFDLNSFKKTPGDDHRACAYLGMKKRMI